MKTIYKVIIIIGLILTCIGLLTAHRLYTNQDKPGGLVDQIIVISTFALIGLVWKIKSKNIND
jgi:hypothetical protein